jgi:hypothetical protein
MRHAWFSRVGMVTLVGVLVLAVTPMPQKEGGTLLLQCRGSWMPPASLLGK